MIKKISYIFALIKYYLLALVLTSSLAYASAYTDGMKAYINGDYELAQIQWLQAAKQEDAKSMFNLGLLHEQQKISNADQAKARNWYRLAGKHGYSAADFHLANLMMANDEKQEEVTALLSRASAKGYVPAQRLLQKLDSQNDVGSIAITLDDKTDESLESGFQADVMQNSQARVERYLSEQWISSKPVNYWTIQMLAFEDVSKVREFIDQHNLKNKAAYFAENNQEGRLYKLIYGAFATKQDADTVRQNMPKNLKEYGPWLRSIGSIQQVINDQ